jgi:hypothetical protein
MLDGGVTVSEDCHVVHHVDVPASVGVEHEVPPATLDARRLLVVVLLRSRQHVVASGHQDACVVPLPARG